LQLKDRRGGNLLFGPSEIVKSSIQKFKWNCKCGGLRHRKK